jgi:hypothetical protein
MTIEVKQLIIRSTVESAAAAGGETYAPDLDRLKEELLLECREVVLELFRERQER